MISQKVDRKISDGEIDIRIAEDYLTSARRSAHRRELLQPSGLLGISFLSPSTRLTMWKQMRPQARALGGSTWTVSYPHGLSQRVTVGKVKNVDETYDDLRLRIRNPQMSQFCNLIMPWHLVVNIKTRFKVPSGQEDLSIYLQPLSTVKIRNVNLFVLHQSRQTRANVPHTYTCVL